MKFTLTIEVDEADILEVMDINNLNREELKHRIGNNLYMGLSCIDAMLNRDLGIEGTESFVHREDKEFIYNDYYPTEKEFPMTEIIARANLNEISWDKKIIDFARQCWAECAIKHNIKTKE